jgi:hypothetical protein
MLETVIGLITGSAGPWIVSAIAAVVALIAARRSGRRAAEAEQARAEIEALRKARGIENTVAGKTDDEIRKEAEKWLKK